MTKHQELMTILLDNNFMTGVANKYSSQEFYPAEDLIQDTILICLEKKEYIKENTNIRGWVCMIMKNTFINVYRRYSTHECSIEIKECEDKVCKSEYEGILDYIVSNEQYKFITEYALGYKYTEIAKMHNLPEGTIKSHIYKQRKQLKEIFNG